MPPQDWDTETAVMQPTGTTGLGVQRGTVTRCTDGAHVERGACSTLLSLMRTAVRAQQCRRS
eukprot:SAG31_NODE_1230_length_9212_cov_3.669264_3_plen_62_part_00